MGCEEGAVCVSRGRLGSLRVGKSCLLGAVASKGVEVGFGSMYGRSSIGQRGVATGAIFLRKRRLHKVTLLLPSTLT